MKIFEKKLNSFVKRPTSSAELVAMGKAMGLDVEVDRAINFNNTTKDYLILNTDPTGPGRHWVAVNKKTKQYFDPYGYDRLKAVPSLYKEASLTKQLQSLNGNNCGPLCLAWLAYGDKIFDTMYDAYRG